jgi:hypothetical protein
MKEICELLDTELDTVSGGREVGAFGPLVNVPVTIQNNFPIQTAVATSIGGFAKAGNGIGGIANLNFPL